LIKVLNQYFPRRWAVLLVSESCLILLALAAAVALEARGWPERPVTPLLLKAVVITIICQICLHYSDLYTPESQSRPGEMLARLLQSLGIASLILALLYWLVPGLRFRTAPVVGAVLAIVLLLLCWRQIMAWALGWASRAFPAGERLLVLGSGERALTLLRELRQRPHLGLELLGVVSEAMAALPEPQALAGADAVTVLGGWQQVGDIIAAERPRRIVIAMQDRRQHLPFEPLIAARTAGIRVEEAPTLFERITGRVALNSVRPSWFLLSDGFRQSHLLRLYQRLTNLLGASLGLLLASPLMLLVAVAIKLDSPGPVIYRQARVGRGGRNFEILKFRSMRADAEKSSGPVWAQERDPRITRLGTWLRTLRFDELPQLWNVLRGDMNFVGPRPERPVFVQQFRESIPYYDVRHSVRPGITGWAQVNRDYGASLEDAREKLEFDLFYIKNVSIWLDLFILFQTTKIIALGRGAR
jgi:sugar transferase (PEP-CTERM system associated)